MNRRLSTRLLLGAVVVLLVLRYAADVSWGARAAVALLVGTVILRVGLATMRPLRVDEKSHPPVDVVEPEGLPVYACLGCGTQLVLLRKGNDRPPRHCGEAMELRIIADATVLPDL